MWCECDKRRLPDVKWAYTAAEVAGREREMDRVRGWGQPNRTIFQTPAEGDNDVKEYAVETGRVDG